MRGHELDTKQLRKKAVLVISRSQNKHDPRYEPTLGCADGDVEDSGPGCDTLDGNAYEAR